MTTVAGAALDERVRDGLADDLERWRRQHRVPGVALAVVGPDDRPTVLVGGVADAATGDPLRRDHRWQIGSISKVVTALTVLRSAEAGAIGLHAPIVRYVPWFRAGPWTRAITVHHLLSHQAGLPIGPDWGDASAYDVWALRDLDVGRPGERFWYSNVGYKALAVALSSVLDRPFPELEMTEVLGPLGVVDADARVGAVDHVRDAAGHEPEPDRYPRSLAARVHAPELVGTMGDGNILGSIEDAARLAAGLLRLHAGSSTLLAPASAATLFAPHARISRGRAYGYGLSLETAGGRRRFGHGGDMPGFRSSLVADPDAAVAVVVLSNLRGAPTRVLARHALEVATSRTPGSPPALELEPQVDPGIAGRYEDGLGTVDLRVEDGRPTLRIDGVDRPLRAIDPATFEVLDAAAGRHHVTVRPPTRRGGPALAFGSRLLGRSDGEPVGRPAGPPRRAAALAGIYRSADPWSRSAEVIVRGGRPRLVDEEGTESELVRLGRDRYRIGAGPNPERAIADAWVDGHPLRLTVSGRPLVRDA